MKYYKDSQGKVFAYEPDGSQDHVIPDDQVPITDVEANALLHPAPTEEQLAAKIRADRDALIAATAWRYERHARETRLGLPTADDIAVLDTYIQALADVPTQAGFSVSVEWPDPLQ